MPGRFELPDLLYALHSLGKLGIVDDPRFSSGPDDGSGLVHAVQIGGTADVLAAVFRVDPAEVHGHVAEIVNRGEAIF